MDEKTKQESYPEVGQIVSNAVEHKRKLYREKYKKDLTITEIISELKESKAGMSAAGFWNYYKGRRGVPPAKAHLMARYFFAGDPKGIGKFIADLEQAAKHAVAAAATTGDGLAGSQSLRIDLTDYPPFSGAVGKLVDHVCRLSALAKENPKRGKDFDMRQALARNEIDIAVGYFANLYRGVQVHFWPTTIKIGLGAVILKKHEKSKELIGEVLAGNRIESRSQLCPILVEGEVGAIHCLKTLQYRREDVAFVEDMTAESLRAEGIAEKLKKVQETSAKIPVAVVDEYTSFQILVALEGQGRPVLPLSSREAARETPRRELPASFLSIGCSRRRSELRDVLEQALQLFLATEVESNALNFASLHKKLLRAVNDVAKKHYPEGKPEGLEPESERKAAAKAFKAAYSWCLYVLGLDYQSIENISGAGLPWAPILRRTRERVLSELADEKDTIREQVCLVAGPDNNPPSEEKFNQLCKSLDLRMQLHGRQREYVLEDRDILVRTIQDGLRGLPVGLPIEHGKDGGRIENFSPKREVQDGSDPDKKKAFEEKMRVLYGFLRDLEEFYTKRVGDSTLGEDIRDDDTAAEKDTGTKEDPDTGVVTKIQRFRHGLYTRYIKPVEPLQSDSKMFGASDDDRVLLASFGKSPTRYLGSGCLRPYPSERGRHPGWLEFFYLWVREDYRQLAVGDQIIKEAKRYAQGISKYTHLVVEVLPTLNEAVTYFRKRDFERGGMTDDGRVILSWKFTKR